MAVLPRCALCQWAREARRCCRERQGRAAPRKALITWNGAKAAKRVRLSVGKDPADAGARRQRKEAELNALNNGVTVVRMARTGIGH